jgi:hypothetical protein
MHGGLGMVLVLGLTVSAGQGLNFSWENPLPGEAASISTNSLCCPSTLVLTTAMVRESESESDSSRGRSDSISCPISKNWYRWPSFAIILAKSASMLRVKPRNLISSKGNSVGDVSALRARSS